MTDNATFSKKFRPYSASSVTKFKPLTRKMIAIIDCRMNIIPKSLLKYTQPFKAFVYRICIDLKDSNMFVEFEKNLL